MSLKILSHHNSVRHIDNLGSTSVVVGSPHLHLTHFDVPICIRRANSPLLYFLFFLSPIRFDSAPIWTETSQNPHKSPIAGQETGWNNPNLLWFCLNKKMKKKDLLPNDLWGKKKKTCRCQMCRLSNRALECDINKAMHMGSSGTWQWSFLEASLFINIPTHLFIYYKTPKFEYLYYGFLNTILNSTIYII